MTGIIEEAIEGLRERLADKELGGTVRFDIKDEGSVRVEGATVEASDAEADCVLRASEKNFRKLLDGKLNPASAVMTGKLKVEGEMGVALKLASLL